MLAAAQTASKLKSAPVPSSVHAEHEEPVSVTGQETIFDSRSDVFTVKGDAVMTQGGSILKADQIEVFRRLRQARATGNVHLVDPEVEMWASRATIDLNSERLVMYDAKVFAKKDTYHLAGKKIEKLEGQNYAVTDGFFTTCGCRKDTPDWAITADQMDVSVGGVGKAHGAGFDILGQQVMKVPFAEFPADSNRHSGFLSSREGESGLRGFQYFQPYYWAINKSSDATLAFDLETSQRIGGMGEYRLTNGKDDYFWADAAYYNEAIRSDSNREEDVVDNQIADTHIPENRWDGIAMARQHITDDLTLYGDTITTSDSLLLREVNNWTLSRGFGSNLASLRNAISNFGLLDSFENAFARVQGTFNQDLIQPQTFALQRLPEAELNGRQQLPGAFGFADYNASVTNFYRDEGQSGWRFNAMPEYTLPVRLGDYATAFGTVGALANGWESSGNLLKITPVGTKGLIYNNGVSLGTPLLTQWQGRVVPFMQTGVSTVLDRVYDVDGTTIEKLKNTIEPFADYSYVPRISQGNTPLYDQYDRMEARSLVSYGFTTRLFAKVKDIPASDTTDQAQDLEPTETGSVVGPYNQQQPDWSAVAPGSGQIVREGEHTNELAQLTVQQAYDTSHEISADSSHVSDLQGLLSIYPTSIASLGSEVDYNPRGHAGITYSTAFVDIQPPWAQNPDEKPKVFMGRALEGSFLEFAYNYVNSQNTVFQSTSRGGSEFASARAYTDLFDYLGVFFAPSYDFSSDRLLEAEYGARLKSPCDCWAADFGLIQSYNPNEVQFQFQLTLGGLGSLGQSPFGRNPFQTRNAGSVLPSY
jgi:LPS-assembly protein